MPHRPIAPPGAEQPGRALPTDEVALDLKGDVRDSRRLGHAQLRDEADRSAGALRALGIGRGDRGALRLLVLPELVVALLACDQGGALPTAPAGLPGAVLEPDDELLRRDRGRSAKLVIAADGGYRKGWPIRWTPGRDHWWHDVTGCRPIRPWDMYPGGGGPGRFGLRAGAGVLWCAAVSDWLAENPTGAREPLAADDPAGLGALVPLWRLVEKCGVTVWHADPVALADLLGGTLGPVDGYDPRSLRPIAGLSSAPGRPGRRPVLEPGAARHRPEHPLGAMRQRPAPAPACGPAAAERPTVHGPLAVAARTAHTDRRPGTCADRAGRHASGTGGGPKGSWPGVTTGPPGPGRRIACRGP